MSDRLLAPWSDDAIERLNKHQRLREFHPYTCPERDESTHSWRHGDLGVLVAMREGFMCPDCGYSQDWAYADHAMPRWELDLIDGSSD